MQGVLYLLRIGLDVEVNIDILAARRLDGVTDIARAGAFLGQVWENWTPEQVSPRNAPEEQVSHPIMQHW